jgi:tripartite-type tricarboxylate transporter receptor subunit TctC
MAAPAKTPPAVLDRLNAEIGRMLANPEVQQRLASLAFVAVGGSREQFGAFMKAEIEKWSELARKTGAKAD